MLRLFGTFVQVGNPEDHLPPVAAGLLISKGIKLAGSTLGSPEQVYEMLQLAADEKLHPLVEKRPMSDANQTILDLESGKPRYRYVLVNEH